MSTNLMKEADPGHPCYGKHWWYWVRPMVLKCKRCGRIKRAEK